MIRCFLLFFIHIAVLSAASLKERFERAKPGDYLVFESNKMVTLLAIRSISSQSVIFEEISTPIQSIKPRPTSWGDWIKKKAPGHSSWSMTEIDLNSGEIIECYSFSRSAWIQISSQKSLFATLLHLTLQPLADEKQPRIGPPPMPGEMDVRKIWVPQLCFEGMKQSTPLFDAYETVWPQDGSDFANKTIFLYFDQQTQFPFPFWMQVAASYGSLSLRAIDAGRKLPSFFSHLPRRMPQFIGQPQRTVTGLRMLIKTPKYYEAFELFAIDVTQKERQIQPIAYHQAKRDLELLTIEIKEEELAQHLEPNHLYTWLLVPIGSAQSYAETVTPFFWPAKKGEL
jgi:hypothetical protein